MNPTDICSIIAAGTVAHSACLLVAAIAIALFSYYVGHQKGIKKGGDKKDNNDA
jgi:hypothetical protein